MNHPELTVSNFMENPIGLQREIPMAMMTFELSQSVMLQKMSAGDSQVMTFKSQLEGAQWLSGRVLDSRLRGHGFKPHRRHCVVVLEQDTFILA